MPKAERSVVADADADTVRQPIRDFNGPSSWVPGRPAARPLRRVIVYGYSPPPWG